MKPSASKSARSAFLGVPLALCLTPLITLPAYATDTPTTTAPVAASRTSIDRESGRLRAPEADETVPAGASQGASSRSAARSSMLTSPNALRFQPQTMYGKDGTETRRLDLSRSLRFSVVHRDADGSLHKDCVAGEEAAATHLSAAPIKGANHE